MTQIEFMQRFKRGIASIPKERQQEIIEDISQHFEEGIAANMGEAELAAQLGNPELLAKEYRASQAVERANDHMTAGNVLSVIWAAIGMGMLNLILIFPIWISLFVAWISLMAASLAMTIAGVGGFLGVIIGLLSSNTLVYVTYPLASIFACIASTSLGLLLGIGMLHAGKWFARVTLQYVQANLGIITRKRRKE